MRKYLIPLRLVHFFRFKLFIHFIMNFVIFCSAQKALASNSCHAIYSVQRPNAEIMALLDPKFQTSLRSLAEMHLSIELMKQKNPDSIVAVSMNDAYQKKYYQHLEYFRKNEIMNEDEMKSIMREYILEKQGRLKQDKDQENERRRKERQEIEVQTIIETPVIDGSRAILHRIYPSSVRMGKLEKIIDINIMKPFEMMATQTTQIIWRKIAELASQRFQGKYQINADPSHFKGDLHPVEMVSYDDVQIWLKALNELSVAGEPDLADLIPDHKMGDFYRLPTNDEWEFVVRGGGQYNGMYHFGDQQSQVGEYAWFARNSDNKTHPVAQKKPLITERKEFYDMYGNVMEWVHNSHEFGNLRGGSWQDFETSMFSDARADSPTSIVSANRGFRFVRGEPLATNNGNSVSQQNSNQTAQPVQQTTLQSAQKTFNKFKNKFKFFLGQRPQEQGDE
jgi:hypothetical protein